MQQWVLENKGSFETNRACNIPAYRVYGKTIRKRLFATDKEPRYIHIYHSTDLETHERGEVEKKINSLTAFLRSHINQFKDFGPGMETYFELHYDENAKKRGGKEREGDKKQAQTAAKFVFFEEKTHVIELELNLCGYFVIVTSEKMTAKEALELYKGRDASEKLFLSDKTFLGNHCLRVDSDEAAASKVFIEFVALIIRNRIYGKIWICRASNSSKGKNSPVRGKAFPSGDTAAAALTATMKQTSHSNLLKQLLLTQSWLNSSVEIRL